MPTAKISPETLHQMLLDTRSDMNRIQGHLDGLALTANQTNVYVANLNSKLDRFIDVEARVVQLGHDVDRAKGMGLAGGALLGLLEGIVGVYSFFRH